MSVHPATHDRHPFQDLIDTLSRERMPSRDRPNGNGHHAEAPAPQASLFSWAEFMAEPPAKPTGRRRTAQAPALSLFEWALEQERAPVGAGR